MTAAEIYDRGYRRFEGERSGVPGAMRSLTWYTTKSMLGIGRKGRHKVFPVLVAVIAFLPTVIIFGIVALFGEGADSIRPEYYEFLGPSDSFGFLIIAHFLYATLVAPEALVRDRRDGMLSLYLSTPLTRPTYVVSKVLSVAATMAIVVIGPAVILLLGYTLQGQGPDGFVNWLEVFAKILLGGLIIVLVYSGVSMGVSSLTDRRAFASIAVIMTLLGLSIVAAVLVEQAGMSDRYLALDPLGAPFEAVTRLFGDRSFEGRNLSTSYVSAVTSGWVVVGFGTLVFRYRRIGAI
jgi:ABC-2 type transport system permease protein